ncbi:MAG: JAB domain-containing protein [Candidatus Anammoxibacter sp.]
MFIKELSVSYRKKRIPKTAHKCLGEKIRHSQQIYKLFEDMWKECVEKFYVLHMDNKHVIQAVQLVSMGHLTASVVHPREVYKAALVAGSAAVAFVHNHPAGEPKPSDEDIAITRRLQKVGDLVGIEVLDHVIVGDSKYFSLKDKGLL